MLRQKPCKNNIYNGVSTTYTLHITTHFIAKTRERDRDRDRDRENRICTIPIFDRQQKDTDKNHKNTDTHFLLFKIKSNRHQRARGDEMHEPGYFEQVVPVQKIEIDEIEDPEDKRNDVAAPAQD